MRTVSVSRSSPTTMTSGSSRSEALSALAKDRERRVWELEGRVDERGRPLSLKEQDRGRWLRGMIEEGVALRIEEIRAPDQLDRLSCRELGRFVLAAPREQLRARRAPEHVRRDVVRRGRLLAESTVAFGLVVLALIFGVFFSLFTPGFSSPFNLFTLGRSMAKTGLLIGQTIKRPRRHRASSRSCLLEAPSWC